MTDQNSQFFAILTAVGEAKQANADALGIAWQITQLGVGDANGTEPIPDREQTALINERRRAPLNQLSVDPQNAAIIIAEQVIPAEVGGWWIREIGLYDADNDLVAIANCAPSFKPLLSQGSGRTQVVRMNLIVTSSASVQLKIDPSVVLATRAYVDNVISVHMAAANPHPQYQLRGAVTTLNATAAITVAQLGLLLLDASAGSRTFTLPSANAALGIVEVVLRRVDITNNALVISAAGADKLLLDTTAQAEGQSTTELLFAGDFLRLRSDGAGKWYCVGQAQLPGSIATGLVVFTVFGASIFNVPAVLRSGRRFAKVTCIGGGGGGTRFINGGGGGGGGGISIKRVDLTGVVTVATYVGAGGLGRVGSDGSAAPGTATSFGAYCSATGGGGASNWQGGASGYGSGGDVNTGYGPGAPTAYHNYTSSLSKFSGGFGGGPGSNTIGNGAQNSAGIDAAMPGGGGSGGNENGNGGDGFRGLITIEW